MKFNNRAFLCLLSCYHFINCVFGQTPVLFELRGEEANFRSSTPSLQYSPITVDGYELYEILLEKGTVSIGTELYHWLSAAESNPQPGSIEMDAFIYFEGNVTHAYNVTRVYPSGAREIANAAGPGEAFFEFVRLIAEAVQETNYY
jgi:hypothetical protein